jgi:hypothetical protein
MLRNDQQFNQAMRSGDGDSASLYRLGRDDVGGNKTAMNWLKRLGHSRVVLGLCCLALMCWWLVRVERGYVSRYSPYDDAFMFYRYAVHMHAGSGIAWNAQGGPTYGVTSPMWLFVVWFAMFFIHNMTGLILGASIFSGILAMFAMGWAIWSNARSSWLQQKPAALLLAIVLIFPMSTFVISARNGMETLFSCAIIAVMVGVVMRWIGGKTNPALAGIAGLGAFLTRPESALGMLVILAAAFFLLGRHRRKQVFVAAGVFFAGLIVEMLCCKMYFGSALPLSFYIKAQHSYIGYIRGWRPVSNAVLQAANCLLPISVILLFATKRQWRLLVFCVVPAIFTFLYLTTTLQIMGGDGRYYVPYSVYLVIGAALIIDARIADDTNWQKWQLAPLSMRLFALLLIVAATRRATGNPILDALDARAEGPYLVYNRPTFEIKSTTSLPKIDEMTERFAVPEMIQSLPNGATVASSEVGYLGALQPWVNVIDLVGLNDTQIALHGFHMDYLLSKHPDVIWMVHPDYSHQYGVMLSDPRLLEMYDVYPGAGSYGLALLKNSPYRASIDHNMQAFWKSQYHDLPMEQYRALSIRWDGQFHTSARAVQE